MAANIHVDADEPSTGSRCSAAAGVNVVVHDHGLHRRRAEFFAPFWAALGVMVACRSAHFLGLTWGNVVGDTGLEPMTSAV